MDRSHDLVRDNVVVYDSLSIFRSNYNYYQGQLKMLIKNCRKENKTRWQMMLMPPSENCQYCSPLFYGPKSPDKFIMNQASKKHIAEILLEEDITKLIKFDDAVLPVWIVEKYKTYQASWLNKMVPPHYQYNDLMVNPNRHKHLNGLAHIAEYHMSKNNYTWVKYLIKSSNLFRETQYMHKQGKLSSKSELTFNLVVVILGWAYLMQNCEYKTMKYLKLLKSIQTSLVNKHGINNDSEYYNYFRRAEGLTARMLQSFNVLLNKSCEPRVVYEFNTLTLQIGQITIQSTWIQKFWLRKIRVANGNKTCRLKYYKQIAKVQQKLAKYTCAYCQYAVVRVKICSGCKQVRYCGKQHQKKDWKRKHRNYCSKC